MAWMQSRTSASWEPDSKHVVVLLTARMVLLRGCVGEVLVWIMKRIKVAKRTWQDRAIMLRATAKS